MNTAPNTNPSKTKVIPILWLLVQVATIGYLGWLGSGLPFNNSIETFAVSHTRAETDFALLHKIFPADDQFIVAIQFKQGFPETSASAYLDQFAQIPGMKGHLSEKDLFPEGVPQQAPTPPLPFQVPGEHLHIGYYAPEDGPKRHDTMAQVWALAQSLQTTKPEVAQVVVAGESMVNYHLNVNSMEVKQRFFPMLIGFSILLLGLLFRDVKALLAAALAVAGSLASTMGLMALFGEELNLVTTLIPALIFVLSIAMQIHVLISISHVGSIRDGMVAKLKPNFLITLTTSIGFGSLMTSQVLPIAIMGKYMAIGMWFVFLWAHLIHLSISPLLNLKAHLASLDFLMVLFQKPFYAKLLRRRFLLFESLLLLVLGSWLMWRNPTESNGLNYFPTEHPIRVATRFVEAKVTGASQVEILLENVGAKPEDVDSFMPDPQALSDLVRGLERLPHVRNLIHLQGMSEYLEACSELELEPNLSEALLNSFISPDYYRIQLLVDSLDRKQYQTLREEISAALNTHHLAEGSKISGILDRIVEIQNYLLSSLLSSLLLTIATVMALLTVVFGRKVSLVALCLPNLFPLACMALAMYLLGIPTSISSVMVFSIAFGIAVDDTIHLTYTFQHLSGTNESRWRMVLEKDARAVTLTTLVLTSGFAILISSSFLPTQQFGLLLCVGMLSAWFADLVLLPHLLIGKEPEQTSQHDATRSAK